MGTRLGQEEVGLEQHSRQRERHSRGLEDTGAPREPQGRLGWESTCQPWGFSVTHQMSEMPWDGDSGACSTDEQFPFTHGPGRLSKCPQAS